MNNKGYITIVELLVIIAIIGILSSVVLCIVSPECQEARNKGAICEKRKMDCRVDCTELEEADEMNMCLEKCDIKFEQCNL